MEVDAAVARQPSRQIGREPGGQEASAAPPDDRTELRARAERGPFAVIAGLATAVAPVSLAIPFGRQRLCSGSARAIGKTSRAGDAKRI